MIISTSLCMAGFLSFSRLSLWSSHTYMCDFLIYCDCMNHFFNCICNSWTNRKRECAQLVIYNPLLNDYFMQLKQLCKLYVWLDPYVVTRWWGHTVIISSETWFPLKIPSPLLHCVVSYKKVTANTPQIAWHGSPKNQLFHIVLSDLLAISSGKHY